MIHSARTHARKKENLDCAAIVVNYNSGKRLYACLSSALADPSLTELVVVDNASSDKSIESAHKLGDMDSRVRIIQNDQNIGFGAAVNQGVEQTRADLLLVLNPDCVFGGGVIAELIHALVAHPDAAIAGALVLNPDGSEQRATRRDIPNPATSATKMFGLDRFRLLRKYNFERRQEILPKEPVLVDAVSGAFFLIRRGTWKTVGGFDEGYFLHCEDLDLFLRVRQAGARILFVPGAVVTHYQGSCSSANPIKVEWHKHRGMIRFYRKFYASNNSIARRSLVYGGIAVHFVYAAAAKIRWLAIR